MEPVEINNGTWYLRGLRYDDRVDDRPALADLGETDLDYVHDAEDGWADDTRYTWAVCEPTTGELLAEVTLDPKTSVHAERAAPATRTPRRCPRTPSAATPRRSSTSGCTRDACHHAPTRPKVVTVTGAAGQIGYAALFRIGAGALLGRGVPVTLRLLELPSAVRAAEGVVMELVDSAFDLLGGVEIHDDPVRAFDGVDVALLVGAKPAARAWSAPTCWPPTPRSSPTRAGAQRRRGRRRPDRGGRQPGQHQRAASPPLTRRTFPPSGSPR